MAPKKTGKNAPKGKKNDERETTQEVSATLSEDQLALVVEMVSKAMQKNGGGGYGGGKPKFESVEETVVFDDGTVRHIIQKVEMTRNGEVEPLIIFGHQRKATKTGNGVKKGQWRNTKVSGAFRYADKEAIIDAVANL